MPTTLLILLGLPLAGAVAVALLGSLLARSTPGADATGLAGSPPGAHATGLARRDAGVRWLALACTLASLALALVVAVQYAAEVAPERSAAELEERIFVPAFATTWDLLPLGGAAGGKGPAIQ